MFTRPITAAAAAAAAVAAVAGGLFGGLFGSPGMSIATRVWSLRSRTIYPTSDHPRKQEEPPPKPPPRFCFCPSEQIFADIASEDFVANNRSAL